MKSIDLPIAGRGYNALPFVFDFVNLANGQKIPDSTQKRFTQAKLEDDSTGDETVQFLKNVRERLRWVTGENPPSLGLHPAVYTYSRAGAFQPTLFLAMSEFVENLKTTRQLKLFQSVRKDFENFLFEHKALVSEIGHRFGSGERSIGRIVSYYSRLMENFASGDSEETILDSLSLDKNFKFLWPLIKKTDEEDDQGSGGKPFTRETKTAAFLTAAIDGGVRCSLCGALVHKNSMNFDHGKRIREQGSNALDNAGPSHFWCNSDKQ